MLLGTLKHLPYIQVYAVNPLAIETIGVTMLQPDMRRNYAAYYSPSLFDVSYVTNYIFSVGRGLQLTPKRIMLETPHFNIDENIKVSAVHATVCLPHLTHPEYTELINTDILTDPKTTTVQQLRKAGITDCTDINTIIKEFPKLWYTRLHITLLMDIQKLASTVSRCMPKYKLVCTVKDVLSHGRDLADNTNLESFRLRDIDWTTCDNEVLRTALTTRSIHYTYNSENNDAKICIKIPRLISGNKDTWRGAEVAIDYTKSHASHYTVSGIEDLNIAIGDFRSANNYRKIPADTKELLEKLYAFKYMDKRLEFIKLNLKNHTGICGEELISEELISSTHVGDIKEEITLVSTTVKLDSVFTLLDELEHIVIPHMLTTFKTLTQQFDTALNNSPIIANKVTNFCGSESTLVRDYSGRLYTVPHREPNIGKTMLGYIDNSLVSIRSVRNLFKSALNTALEYQEHLYSDPNSNPLENGILTIEQVISALLYLRYMLYSGLHNNIGYGQDVCSSYKHTVYNIYASYETYMRGRKQEEFPEDQRLAAEKVVLLASTIHEFGSFYKDLIKVYECSIAVSYDLLLNKLGILLLVLNNTSWMDVDDETYNLCNSGNYKANIAIN